MLDSVHWWVVPKFSGNFSVPFLTVTQSKTLEDGTDRFSRNIVTSYQPMLPNIPEERRSHSHRGISRNHAVLKFGVCSDLPHVHSAVNYALFGYKPAVYTKWLRASH